MNAPSHNLALPLENQAAIWLNRVHIGDNRETMRQMLTAGVRVNRVVTSPPYWGLRDYGANGQIGLERTPEAYVNNIVDTFDCVRDLLSEHGTAWLVIGDSYHNGDKGGYAKDRIKSMDSLQRSNLGANFIGAPNRQPHPLLKPKDLCGIPWRVAFALQEAGWWLRQDVVWSKSNPMPESVTDRCVKAHEYVFLLSKSERYFFDHFAIREPSSHGTHGRYKRAHSGYHPPGQHKHRGFLAPRENINSSGNKERKPRPGAPEGTGRHQMGSVPWEGASRNKRSVWPVTVKPYKDAHFATFPPDLIEPCVLAGTSEHGHCPSCGGGWRRLLRKGSPIEGQKRYAGADAKGGYSGKALKAYAGAGAQDASATKARILAGMVQRITIGWRKPCNCGLDPAAGIVFDPFMGSGTTAQVAHQLGRNWIGCELNPDYERLVQQRLAKLEGVKP